MFSLKKLAYCACNELEKLGYNYKETLEIDVKYCCLRVLKFLKDKEEYLTKSATFGKYNDI